MILYINIFQINILVIFKMNQKIGNEKMNIVYIQLHASSALYLNMFE